MDNQYKDYISRTTLYDKYISDKSLFQQTGKQDAKEKQCLTTWPHPAIFFLIRGNFEWLLNKAVSKRGLSVLSLLQFGCRSSSTTLLQHQSLHMVKFTCHASYGLSMICCLGNILR